jgi:uncharacterized protein YcgI (DUF1989 family)
MIRQRIEPQSGVGFALHRGQTLRVIDPVGEQVSDLIAFAKDDRAEWLSSGRTIDYNNTIYMTKGHRLYSNRSNVMLTIVEDTVGRHDFLYTPCSRETFTLLYDCREYHPSCLENLSRALVGYRVVPDSIATTFNIFMNVDLKLNGELRVMPPRSRKNDFIESVRKWT